MDALEWLASAARIALALYIGAAAVAKVLDGPEMVRMSVADFTFVPRAGVDALAYALVACEVSVSLGLLVGPADAAAVLTALLMIAFAAGACSEILRGRRHDCGCFGALSARPIGWSLVLEDAVIGSAAVLVALHPGVTQGTVLQALGSGLEGALAAVAGVAMFLALLLWSESDANAASFRQWLDTYTSAAVALDQRR